MEKLQGYCQDCPLRPSHDPNVRHCVLRENALLDDVDMERLMDTTAFSRWKTPTDLGKRYSYTAKHVIRLVSNPANRIIATIVDKRWFVLECTFARFVEGHGRPRPANLPHDPDVSSK